MRRAFKLAVMVGGIGALAWGMRKKVRIAIGRGDGSDPDYRIINPAPDTAVGEVGDEAEADGSPAPSQDSDLDQDLESDAQNGVD